MKFYILILIMLLCACEEPHKGIVVDKIYEPATEYEYSQQEHVYPMSAHNPSDPLYYLMETVYYTDIDNEDYILVIKYKTYDDDSETVKMNYQNIYVTRYEYNTHEIGDEYTPSNNSSLRDNNNETIRK